MTNLPILTCDGCGACCLEQDSPPMYLGILLNPATNAIDGDDDTERVRRLPDQARCELLAYGENLMSGFYDGGPCIWLDQSTMQCRWHEHRPQICRDHELGGESCRGWRQAYNVEVEAIQ